ncbi:MAG: hypothetical protein E7342_02500 [Clostridiales bacterium]|nr:hypothetical protein [Clostridiales bacterium]
MVNVIAVAIISAILILYLNSINKELALIATISAGLLITFMLFDYFEEIFGFFDKLISLTSIDKSIYKIIIKITLIGYIVEFSAGIVEDFGMKSLSLKLIVAGKVIILCMSLPILYSVLELLINLLQ